jgi:ADP-specific phosphofructokinase/glucokinase
MASTYSRETVARLLDGAPQVDSRTIAMGFTANLDVLLAGNSALTAQMRKWCEASSAVEAAVWRAILDEQTRCALAGRGGELALEPADVLARFEEHGIAMTIGGTGVRAAAQAARLGQRTIVSIPAADPRLASLLAGHLMALVPVSCSTGLPTHYVVELPGVTGGSGPADESVSAQRPNRLILRGEETRMPLLPDSFITNIVRCRPPVRMLVLSGFNTYTGVPELEQALSHAVGWLRELRRRAPHVWIYLEMAGFASRAALHRVLRVIGPLVDAVGMNEDECDIALNARQVMGSLSPSAQMASMREMLSHYGLERLIVHTAWMSCYLGSAPLTGTEREAAARALALSNTAAGFRFANGFDGAPGELQAAARAWELAPEGIDCANAAHGHSDMVVLPAWQIPHGAGTIGLGDSFTGALTTGLDPPGYVYPSSR